MTADDAPSQLAMWVLDAVQDDIESVETIRGFLGHAGGTHEALEVSDQEIAAALVSLLAAGLVAAYEYAPSLRELVVVEAPDLAEASIMRSWFSPTEAGRRAWEVWDASFPE